MKKKKSTPAPVVNAKYPTRENWLNAAVEAMRPFFLGKNYKIPAIRVSCGWPSRKALSAAGRALGQAWAPEASADGIGEIFVSPYLSAAVGECGVLSVLVHEVVHQVVGIEHGHKKPFGECARAVGLQGKLTCTTAGPDLLVLIGRWSEALGGYPHASLDSCKGPVKKQTTRMKKCECADCGYTVRLAQKWLDIAVPECPVCKEPMLHDGAAKPAPDEDDED